MGQGIHHHQYEEFNATRPSQTPKYRSSHLYKKSSSSAANNQNPSLENTDFIEDGHYIQLTSSKSRNLHGNLAHKKKKISSFEFFVCTMSFFPLVLCLKNSVQKVLSQHLNCLHLAQHIPFYLSS